MPPRRPLIVLLLLLLLGGAAGCGGKTGLPDIHRANREAWVGRANRVCADRAAAVRKLPAPRTQNELIDAGARIVSLEEREYSRLAGLHPPADVQGEASAFLVSLQRIPREIERFRSALVLRNAANLVGARAALAAARRDANARARGLGLSCQH